MKKYIVLMLLWNSVIAAACPCSTLQQKAELQCRKINAAIQRVLEKNPQLTKEEKKLLENMSTVYWLGFVEVCMRNAYAANCKTEGHHLAEYKNYKHPMIPAHMAQNWDEASKGYHLMRAVIPLAPSDDRMVLDAMIKPWCGKKFAIENIKKDGTTITADGTRVSETYVDNGKLRSLKKRDVNGKLLESKTLDINDKLIDSNVDMNPPKVGKGKDKNEEEKKYSRGILPAEALKCNIETDFPELAWWALTGLSVLCRLTADRINPASGGGNRFRTRA